MGILVSNITKTTTIVIVVNAAILLGVVRGMVAKVDNVGGANRVNLSHQATTIQLNPSTNGNIRYISATTVKPNLIASFTSDPSPPYESINALQKSTLQNSSYPQPSSLINHPSPQPSSSVLPSSCEPSPTNGVAIEPKLNSLDRRTLVELQLITPDPKSPHKLINSNTVLFLYDTDSQVNTIGENLVPESALIST
jgi:hypothetical protein